MPAIRPYGDTLNDGVVQISFTLPIPCDGRAREIARRYAMGMNIPDPLVVQAEVVSPATAREGAFTFFVVYGSCAYSLDPEDVQVDEVEHPVLSFEQTNALILERLGRRLVVLGAAIESDAHTVGIDAIFNAKGYAGHYGLERYPAFDARNLGAQVSCETLLRIAVESSADALLVSQVVTQKNVHVQNLTRLVELAEAEGLREGLVCVVGGPRLSHAFAKELGYDAGFGPGTTPDRVASYLAQEIVARHEEATENVQPGKPEPLR